MYLPRFGGAFLSGRRNQLPRLELPLPHCCLGSGGFSLPTTSFAGLGVFPPRIGRGREPLARGRGLCFLGRHFTQPVANQKEAPGSSSSGSVSQSGPATKAACRPEGHPTGTPALRVRFYLHEL